MRSLQTRLLKRGDADGSSPPAPAPMVVGGAAGDGGEQPAQPPLQPLQPLQPAQLAQQQAARSAQQAELALPAACGAVCFFPPPPPPAAQAVVGSVSPELPPSIAAEASYATMSE